MYEAREKRVRDVCSIAGPSTSLPYRWERGVEAFRRSPHMIDHADTLLTQASFGTGYLGSSQGDYAAAHLMLIWYWKAIRDTLPQAASIQLV